MNTAMIDDGERAVDTKEMADLLTKRGFTTAPATLVKLRCVGGGPPYIKFRKAVRYRPSVGLAWASEKARTLHSTADEAA